MQRLLGLLILLLSVATAPAHPGVGIVQDSRGNVFFTDTKQVWKITSDGKKSVAVADVHTHELCFDDKGNLYGEHLWYEGDATKKWGHRVWRLKSDGTVSDVIPAREGFLKDYSFVRDREGNMWTPMVKGKSSRGQATRGRHREGRSTSTATCGYWNMTPPTRCAPVASTVTGESASSRQIRAPNAVDRRTRRAGAVAALTASAPRLSADGRSITIA